MQDFLIVGGTRQERTEKAEEMIQKYKISHFDKIVLEIENVKSIGIEQIRRLQRQFSLKPYHSKYQAAIIPEAEKLTVSAQNAMLKLLEEPPKNTIIILCSPNSDSLLPTIISRCQIISLPLKPQIEIDRKIFNSQFSILNSILKAGVGERIRLADKIAKNREEAIKFCQAQLIIWREKMLDAKKTEEGNEKAKVIRQIQKTISMLNANANPKLCLENLFFKYPSRF